MSTNRSPLPELACLCAATRRAARILTQLYDSYLRASGIEASQFTLLRTLKEYPRRSQNEIAQVLAFNKTTLSRNLKLLAHKGWIALTPSGDRRQHSFVVTRSGLARLKAAIPYWQNAQTDVHSRLGRREWNAGWKALAALSQAGRSEMPSKTSRPPNTR